MTTSIETNSSYMFTVYFATRILCVKSTRIQIQWLNIVCIHSAVCCSRPLHSSSCISDDNTTANSIASNIVLCDDDIGNRTVLFTVLVGLLYCMDEVLLTLASVYLVWTVVQNKEKERIFETIHTIPYHSVHTIVGKGRVYNDNMTNHILYLI